MTCSTIKKNHSYCPATQGWHPKHSLGSALVPCSPILLCETRRFVFGSHARVEAQRQGSSPLGLRSRFRSLPARYPSVVVSGPWVAVLSFLARFELHSQ